jgi:hypothetical protein
MVLPPPPLPLVGREENTHSTSANSSPIVSVYTVCWVLKARASLDWPLPASGMGGKDKEGNGGDNGGNASCGG